MSKTKKKNCAVLVLIAFLLTLMPMPVMAADGDNSGSGGSTTTPMSIEWINQGVFSSKNYEVDDQIELNFTVKDVPNKGATINFGFSDCKDFLIPQSYVAGSKITNPKKDAPYDTSVKLDGGVATVNITAKLKVGTKAGTYGGTFTFGNESGAANMTVLPGIIDATKGHSITNVTYLPQEADQKPSAAINIELRDKYNNLSTNLGTGNKLFIWSNPSGAKIVDANGNSVGNGYTPTSSAIYFNISGDDIYEIYWGVGTGVNACVSKAPKQTVDFRTLGLNIRGDLTTHVTNKNPGTISVRLNGGSGKNYYLRLPEGFRVIGDELIPISSDNDDGSTFTKDERVVQIKDGENLELRVVRVPGEKEERYQEKTGEITAESEKLKFKLYTMDKQEIQFVSKDCDITVKAEDISAMLKIANAGKFRYSLDDPIQDVDKYLHLTFPNWLNPYDAGYRIEVTTSGSSIIIDKPNDIFIADGFSKTDGVKVQPLIVTDPSVDAAGKKRENIKVYVKIYTMGASGGLFATGTLDLVHSMTDTMLKITDVTIGTPSKVEEVIRNGQIYNKTTVRVKVPDEPLNGNGLFVWIEDISEDAAISTIKEYFDVDVSDNRLKSTNSYVGPGTAVTGSSNVFEITPVGGRDDFLGVREFDLVIYSQKPGKFKVHMAIAEQAKDVGSVESITGGDEFEFIEPDNKASITLENVGTIWGGPSSQNAGKFKYTLENTTWKQGDTIILMPPASYRQNTSDVTSSQALQIRLGEPSKGKNIFKGEVILPYAPILSDGDIGFDDLKQWQMYKDNKLVDVKFAGGLTITKRRDAGDVLVDIVTGSGFNGTNAKVLVDTEAKATITLQDQKSRDGEKLKGKALLVWLSDDKGKIVSTKDKPYLTIDDKKFDVAGEGKGDVYKNGQLVVTWKDSDITSANLSIPLKVDKFTDADVSKVYQIHVELVTVDDQGQLIAISDYKADSMKSFTVVKTLNETEWSFNVKVNNTQLQGSSSGVFRSEELALNTRLEIEAQLLDENGNVLANQEVTASVNDNSLKLSAEKATTDANGKVIFTGTPTTQDDFDYIITLSASENNDKKATASVVIPIRKDPNNSSSSGDYSNLDLMVRGMTDTVARGKTASIYLEAYDKDDKLVKVTSDEVARKIISRVRLMDVPSSSDLNRDHVYFKRSGDGIVVYFTPDVSGVYEVRIEGSGNDPSVLTRDITAIRQGDIVRMELEYDETTLGIGERSHPARIYTYDSDGNRAQRSLLDTRLEITSSGSAVENLSPMGVVTVRNNSRYVGNTIRVMVVDERNNLSAEWIFNVDERSSTNSDREEENNIKDIVLWDNYGGVGMTNRIQFYLTDGSGFRAILEPGQLTTGNASAKVTIASKPAGATVTASLYNNGRTLEEDGYGYLDIYSSKEGTVRLNLSFRVYNPDDSTSNWKRYDYYNKTVEVYLTKNITSSNIGIDWGANNNNSSKSSAYKQNKYDISVAMFVGSPVYTVNMMQREMDTTPYIDNGRTYVPIRALSDGLGALVNYDDKTQKISIVYGAERVEMTVGSNVVTTTKRGSYHTDVAPVIQDGRTMIPLRTAAEALGCDVEAVTNQYGSTLGAIFSK